MAGQERVFIGLGANLGDREQALRKALELLEESDSIDILQTSPLYETTPVGPAGGLFLNAVAELAVSLEPAHLLKVLADIEKRMGRVRVKGEKGSRSIDLDILLFGDRIVNERDLVIPHPAALDRLFVLRPLADLVPDLVMPGQGQTVREAARELSLRDPSQRVEPYPGTGENGHRIT